MNEVEGDDYGLGKDKDWLWSPMGRRFLTSGNSKKGSTVLCASIERLGGCALGTPTCRELCYFGKGQHLFHQERYRENLAFTMTPDFEWVIEREIKEFADQHSVHDISICVHEGGEFYSPEYTSNWYDIMKATRHIGNVSFYVYTRSWRISEFRNVLEVMNADCGNVRINQSLDRDLVKSHGVPPRIGDGLITYLSVTDDDLPPPGVDLVFRNLNIKHGEPMEFLGSTLVCPNESGLYIGIGSDGEPAMTNGKCKRIRCQECRLCCDRSMETWHAIKHRFAGTPGQTPPKDLLLPVEMNAMADVA